MKPDHESRTEEQAGRFDRINTWADDTDHDDGTAPVLHHDCTFAERPDCLGCLAWVRHWALERAQVDEANNREWWSA